MNVGLMLLLLREVRSQKLVYLALAFVIYFAWLIGIATSVEVRNGVIDSVRILGQEGSLIELSDNILIASVVILSLGVATAATLIPTMSKTPMVDLLHSKPITRTGLLLSSLVVGVFICFVLFAVLFVSIWCCWGARLGIWWTGLLVAHGVVLAMVLVVNAYVVAFGVVTQRYVLSMFLTWCWVVLLSAILQAREKLLYPLSENGIFRSIIDAMYYIVPQVADLITLIRAAVFGDGILYQPLLYSFLSALAAFSIAMYVFRRKNF